MASRSPNQLRAIVGRCPICGEPADDIKMRPFCSRRCADIDLSRWLNGNYAIPGRADADEDGDGSAAAAGAARSSGGLEGAGPGNDEET